MGISTAILGLVKEPPGGGSNAPLKRSPTPKTAKKKLTVHWLEAVCVFSSLLKVLKAILLVLLAFGALQGETGVFIVCVVFYYSYFNPLQILACYCFRLFLGFLSAPVLVHY